MSAAPVRRAVARTLLVAAIAIAMASAPAAAQTLQALLDPTRPPPEARLGTPGAMDTAPVPSGPQLQSVLLGNHGRQVAVIDGQSLQVGDKIHGATLVKVGRDHVVLQRGRAQQTLKLFPEARASVPKLPATRAPAPAPAPVNSANQ